MSLPHRFACRVYYEDTDFSGVVYHANYLRFFERARTEFLREVGVDHAALFAGQPSMAFAVRRMVLDFRAPARMDDVLGVETRLEALGGASLTVRQVLLREDAVLVTAEVAVALVSGGRPARLPVEVRAKLHAAMPPEALAVIVS